MDEALRQHVSNRAQNRCEYCHLPQRGHVERFSVDHIIAKQHGGADSLDNLALCCLRCNLHKGTNLTGIDPETGQIVKLFDPRRESWNGHFRWNGVIVTGMTPTARASTALLQMNAPERVRLRHALLFEGLLDIT
jgi:hypothetical protein